MPRPVKWSRDLHPIRERAQRAKKETWSRRDIEQLFGISRPSAQNLMKAIGEVQSVGAAHFVDRASLLGFLDEMIGADSVEQALRLRHEGSAPVPRSKTLKIPLPPDLRASMLRDLPANVQLSPGELRIVGDSAEQIVLGLLALAQVMQSDLEGVRMHLEAPADKQADDELQRWFSTPRNVIC